MAAIKSVPVDCTASGLRPSTRLPSGWKLRFVAKDALLASVAGGPNSNPDKKVLPEFLESVKKVERAKDGDVIECQYRMKHKNGEWVNGQWRIAIRH